MELEEKSRMLHKPISKLELPARTLIAAIVRDNKLFVPGGADVMEPGDRIYLLGSAGQLEAAEDLFTSRREATVRVLSAVVLWAPRSHSNWFVPVRRFC